VPSAPSNVRGPACCGSARIAASPRKQRNHATVSANGLAGASSATRRTSSATPGRQSRDLAEPATVLTRPDVAGAGKAQIATAQEAREPMAGAHQVAAQILARAHGTSEPLLLHARPRTKVNSPAAGSRAKRTAPRLTASGIRAQTSTPYRAVGSPRTRSLRATSTGCPCPAISSVAAPLDFRQWA
jgi:hypothetical protein